MRRVIIESLPIITTSEIRTYKRCREEHRLAYALGYRPLRRDLPLAFGSVVHAGLESWWLHHDPERAVRAAREHEDYAGLGPWEQVRAEVMILGYHARWIDESADWETLRVEASFFATRSGYKLGGKLDAVARHRASGRLVVVEHKTTSEDVSPGSIYWRRLTLDDQVGVYVEGGDVLGLGRVDAVLYDVLVKPSRDPLLATPAESRKYRKDGGLYASQREHDESPDEYRARLLEHLAERPDEHFRRAEVVRLDHEREQARRDVHRVAQDILRTDPSEPEPKSPDACKRYGRLCPYFEVCCGEADLDDPARFRRAKTPHEEL